MMKRENSEKRTIGEEFRLIMRGIRIWNELVPGFFVWNIISASVNSILPFFGLYMSSLLVNELAGECRADMLFRLAAISVVVGLGISLINRILKGRINVLCEYMANQHEEYILRKQNEHQYEHTENPDIVRLRAKIFADFNASGGGLYRLTWEIPNMIYHTINIAFSVSLTMSMFTISAKENYTGFFGFVNSSRSAIVIVVLIAFYSFFSIRISMKKGVEIQENLEGLAESNTKMGAYGGLWSADMYIFNLHRIVLEELRKISFHPAWISKNERVEIKYGTLSIILNTVLNIAIFLFVAAKAYIGVFGIGNFILYQGSISQFVSSASWLILAIGKLQYNNRYLVQLYEYLDLPNNMYQGTLTVEKRDDIDYEIEFKDVSFKYPGTDNWVLRHVNIKFMIGDKLAIVGENGSGKSTFIKLLCRLYDPTEGKILLNGIDITRYRYDEYIALFSVVFQDYTLFSFPLGENVATELTYDSEKVRDCLIRVGMGEKLDAIEAYDEAEEKDALKKAIGRDYDEEGVDFSGGEMQKIALARALYKDAPFVVLDEPTAALDPLAEAAVYETFNRIVQNKTSVFISHRLSSCRFCDMIAVFDNGQIVQRGAHDELVSADGKYSMLWRAQSKYYE